MSKNNQFMSFMTSTPTVKAKKSAVENAGSDSRFSRPEGFAIDLTFEEHAAKIFEETKASMALLAK